jgi:hypothetical protein
VGKEAVIAKGDAETGGHVEKEKETDLEPIEPVVPDVEGHGSEGQGVDENQKNAGRPVDAIPRDAGEEWDLHADGVGSVSGATN